MSTKSLRKRIRNKKTTNNRMKGWFVPNGQILIIIVLVCSLMIIFFFEWKSHQLVKKEVIHQTQEQLNSRSKSTAARINVLLKEHIDGIVAIAESRRVQKKLVNGNTIELSENQFPSIVNYYLAHMDHIEGIQLFNSRGHLIFYYPFNKREKIKLGLDLSNSYDVDLVIKGKKPYIHENFFKENDNHSAYILIPVFFENKFAGIIRCKFNMKIIFGLFMKHMNKERDGITIVLDENGNILYHPNSHIIGKRINVLNIQKEILNPLLNYRNQWNISSLPQLFGVESYIAWDYVSTIPITSGKTVIKFKPDSFERTDINHKTAVAVAREIDASIINDTQLLNEEQLKMLVSEIISEHSNIAELSIYGPVLSDKESLTCKASTNRDLMNRPCPINGLILNSNNHYRKTFGKKHEGEYTFKLNEKLYYSPIHTSETLWIVISAIPVTSVLKLYNKHFIHILGLAVLALIFAGIGISTFFHMRNKTKDLETERKYLIKSSAILEKLKQSEERYRDLFNQASNAIILHDIKTGEILDINEKAKEVFGFTMNELKKLKVYDLNDFLSTKEIKEKVGTIINKGYDSFETSIRTNDDQIQYFKVTSRKVHIDGKHVIQSVFRNITKDKRIEAETIRAGQLAAVGELAAGMAHEINNPITGIINYAEILKDEVTSKSEKKKLLEGIIKESDRIAKIIKNLLYFSKDMSTGMAPVSLKDILNSALSLIEKQIDRDGIQLVVDLPENLPVISVISYQIQQVIINIINNSKYALNIKYPEFNQNKRLEITGEIIEEESICYVRLSVYDSGIGIPERFHKKILDPFFSLKPKGQGTGLGLSVSHSIIKNHNGRMFFESVEGEFTRVILDLPSIVYEEWEQL